MLRMTTRKLVFWCLRVCRRPTKIESRWCQRHRQSPIANTYCNIFVINIYVETSLALWLTIWALTVNFSETWQQLSLLLSFKFNFVCSIVLTVIFQKDTAFTEFWFSGTSTKAIHNSEVIVKCSDMHWL